MAAAISAACCRGLCCVGYDILYIDIIYCAAEELLAKLLKVYYLLQFIIVQIKN